MSDPHLAIYNKLEDIDNTLNSLKEASDVEPVLNDISITLKNIDESLENINESLAILPDLALDVDFTANNSNDLPLLKNIVNDLASDVDFIAKNL